GMPDGDAYGTFNMGAGFALYLPESAVPAAQQQAQTLDPAFVLLHAGIVEAGPKCVIVEPIDVTYGASSLQLR
ncbi:MAG TPA: phosphoribosylformylglycinamidine cyclo-ligase, partial [Chloroflexota bacterium]|nr:phosphoribosylformylglycinamidine cyclo-ligase [Chloroflexota bacterium]